MLKKDNDNKKNQCASTYFFNNFNLYFIYFLARRHRATAHLAPIIHPLRPLMFQLVPTYQALLVTGETKNTKFYKLNKWLVNCKWFTKRALQNS